MGRPWPAKIRSLIWARQLAPKAQIRTIFRVSGADVGCGADVRTRTSNIGSAFRAQARLIELRSGRGRPLIVDIL